MGEANDDDRAAERVLGLGGSVLDDGALDQLLEKVVYLTRHAVGRADAVSITMADNGRFRTSNATDPEAIAIDEAQYEGNEGPCLDALRSARQVELDVTTTGDRWPGVRAKARELGFGSVLSTPLVDGSDRALGALNIYSRDDGAFGEADQRTAVMLGEHAAILVGNTLALIGATNLTEQLRAALASREIIGEAKGIIMERQSCTRDEAFDILRRASQRENRKLRDLAEELVRRVETRRGPHQGT